MHRFLNHSPRNHRPAARPCAVLCLIVWAGLMGATPALWAQETGPLTQPMDAADQRADAMLNAQPDQPPAEDQPALATPEEPSIDILDLLFRGGPLMVPIGLLSLVVVIFGIERFLGLRRRKVMPTDLVRGLGQLAGRQGGIDPKAAYRLCQQHPSTMASVVRSMLLKVGRAQVEVEHAVKEANEREAAKLYGNIRPINLAAGIAPLLGLLGTVQGMIHSFFLTANLPSNVNKAESLAQGIYTALVTTFAGLSVAIPAVMLAHYFEGRIQRIFRDIDELLMGVLPQLERFEGKLRPGRLASDGEQPAAPPAAPHAETHKEPRPTAVVDRP